MSVSRIFILFSLYFQLVFGNNVSGVDWQYVTLQMNEQLVLDIQKKFESQTVFIVDSEHGENMQTSNIMHNLVRTFSKEKIYSMTMSYVELEKYEKYYSQQIRRPLYIVFLHNKEQFERFRKISRNYHMSYPIWLLIFSRELSHLCDQPKRNYFHVKFDTAMMVKCHSDPIIREWYNIDGKGMRYLDFASWNYSGRNYDERLKCFWKSGLYYRRNNLEGSALRIASFEASSLQKMDGEVNGYFGTIFKELRDVLNFTVSHVYEETTYGAWDKRTGRYNGIIGRLDSGQVDLGVAEFTMTKERLNVVDFTMPIFVSTNYLYIRKPDKSYLLWSGYFKVYSFSAWVTLQGMFHSSLAIVTLIQLTLKEKPIPANYISQNWLFVWGIFCQQSLPDFPKATPARIAYFSILTTSVILLSVYSACLVSSLTHTLPTVLFKDFQDFAHDGSYGLIAFYNSSDYDLFMTSNDKLWTDMSKLMLNPDDMPRTMIDGFKQVCSKRVAFYGTEAVKRGVSEAIPCDLVTVSSGTIVSLTMTLTKNSQYKKLIDFCLKKFHNHGIMGRLRAKNYKKLKDPKSHFMPVPLTGIAGLLLVMAGGILISLVILIVEIFVHRRNSDRVDRKRLSDCVDFIVITKNEKISIK